MQSAGAWPPSRYTLHAIRIDLSFDPAIACSLPITPRQIFATLVLCNYVWMPRCALAAAVWLSVLSPEDLHGAVAMNPFHTKCPVPLPGFLAFRRRSMFRERKKEKAGLFPSWSGQREQPLALHMVARRSASPGRFRMSPSRRCPGRTTGCPDQHRYLPRLLSSVSIMPPAGPVSTHLASGVRISASDVDRQSTPPPRGGIPKQAKDMQFLPARPSVTRSPACPSRPVRVRD